MHARAIPILVVLAFASPAAAQGLERVQPHGIRGAGHGYGYGYADEFVRGTYVGAPLTRFPRPSQIVPSPWSYGTYGVPTVSGIPPAPVAEPTLTVIGARDGGGRDGATSRRGQAGGEDARAAGLRVIQVQVPRR